MVLTLLIQHNSQRLHKPCPAVAINRLFNQLAQLAWVLFESQKHNAHFILLQSFDRPIFSSWNLVSELMTTIFHLRLPFLCLHRLLLILLGIHLQVLFPVVGNSLKNIGDVVLLGFRATLFLFLHIVNRWVVPGQRLDLFLKCIVLLSHRLYFLRKFALIQLRLVIFIGIQNAPFRQPLCLAPLLPGLLFAFGANLAASLLWLFLLVSSWLVVANFFRVVEDLGRRTRSLVGISRFLRFELRCFLRRFLRVFL